MSEIFNLVIYSTVGCHLCDEARTLLEDVLSHPAFAGEKIKIATVDIADSETLMDEYSKRIPVVALRENGQQISELDWPFNHEEFVNWWISCIQVQA